MSWLKNHFRHFVVPGIVTLSRANGKSVIATDIKPRDKKIRPSSKCKYVEAGMLYSLCSSILRKDNPIREAALGLCRQIGRAKDSEFVYAIDTRGQSNQVNCSQKKAPAHFCAGVESVLPGLRGK